MSEDIQHRIRERARRLWEQDGQPEGREVEHWLEAEREVMAEDGLGEPVTAAAAPSPGEGEQTDLPPGSRPEPQPEIPTDPLRNPEEADPARDPVYGTGRGPEMPAGGDEPEPEMPGDTEARPEIPYESGISELPAAGPASVAADPVEAAPRKRAAASRVSTVADAAGGKAAKPRSGRSGRAKPGEVTT